MAITYHPRPYDERGFTLMEVLIVVAVIAILAVIAIPVFNTQLERTRESTDAANERNAKAACEGAYMVDGTTGTFNFDATSGTLVTTTPKPYGKGTAAGDIREDHTDMYLVCVIAQDGSLDIHWNGISLGSTQTLNSINTVFLGLGGSEIDSGAMSIEGTKAASAVAALKSDYGIDLAQMGATSWRWSKKNNGTLWFTTADISTMSVGDITYMIQYRTDSGNYTVWSVKLGTGSNAANDYSTTYPTLASQLTRISPGDTSQQTYENACELLADKLAGR